MPDSEDRNLELQIEQVEKQLEAIRQVTAEAELLKTLPYAGRILSMVMALEIGRVERFPSAAHLASYAGLVPRVHSRVAIPGWGRSAGM